MIYDSLTRRFFIEGEWVSEVELMTTFRTRRSHGSTEDMGQRADPHHDVPVHDGVQEGVGGEPGAGGGSGDDSGGGGVSEGSGGGQHQSRDRRTHEWPLSLNSEGATSIELAIELVAVLVTVLEHEFVPPIISQWVEQTTHFLDEIQLDWRTIVKEHYGK